MLKEAVLALAFVVLVGCAPVSEKVIETSQPANNEMFPEIIKERMQEIPKASWKGISFTDVSTGSNYKISDFAGKTVLLESFAVWCPVCLRQQEEFAKLSAEDIVVISIDTDPNEDAAIVKNHAAKNSFGWIFAVSPVEMTNSLITDFGFTVVNAPSAPTILVCKDQKARLLKSGVKSSETLLEEISKGC